jgi:SnoaL-like polyketide cyclase
MQNQTSPADLAQAKDLVWRMMQALPGNTAQGDTVTSASAALAQFFAPDCVQHTFHPFNALYGIAAMDAQFWQPLLHAMPNLERRTDLFFAGEFDGRFCGGAGTWVTAHGYLCGTMLHDWLGIPATGDTIYLRIGEFYRVENGKIVDARVLLDIVDVMRQAGFAVLPKSNGLDLLVPGPQTADGRLFTAQDAAETTASMASLDRMIGGLTSFNQKDLKSMGMHAFWHKDMMWYGPCGIGTSRRVEGFQTHHQKPFLHAFPDRKGGNHISRIAEGHYIGSTGWPSVHATHKGDYLGAAAINAPISMRVADWWRREGDTLRENWVMIDLPDLLLQMGVDVFARLEALKLAKAQAAV